MCSLYIAESECSVHSSFYWLQWATFNWPDMRASIFEYTDFLLWFHSPHESVTALWSEYDPKMLPRFDSSCLSLPHFIVAYFQYVRQQLPYNFQRKPCWEQPDFTNCWTMGPCVCSYPLVCAWDQNMLLTYDCPFGHIACFKTSTLLISSVSQS